MSGAGVPVIRRSGQQGLALQDRRTDPKSFIALGISGLGSSILPIAAMLFAFRDEPIGIGIVLLFALPFVAAAFALAYLRWWKTTYRVGENDIRVESGIVSRAARSVPYERIQDVSLEQALIPRLLGLVEVRFETGAGGKDELKLAYLSEAEGERLRELVRDRREVSVAVEDGTPAAEVDDRVLFAMPPRRVLTFGLFEFSLAVVAVLAGAAQQLDFLLPFDLWDLDAWQERLAGPGAWLAGLGPSAQVLGAIIAIGSLLAIGFATGLVRTVLREWGFILTRNAKGLRRRRGLLTRTDVVMPVHRVQAVKIGTGMLRWRFGWQSLKLVSLAQDAGDASHVVAPFAKRHEIEPIIAETGFALPEDRVSWHSTSKAYAFHRALVWLVVTFLLGAGIEAALLLAPDVESSVVLWLPLIIPALGVLAALREWWNWRFRRYALTHQQLFHCHSRLAPHTDIANRAKLQSVEIAQGPLARRGGYATLYLGLAGGTLNLPGLPLADARTLRSELLDSMTRHDFSTLI